jgi:hypothetical protein
LRPATALIPAITVILAAAVSAAATPEKMGWTAVGSTRFPVPEGTQTLAVPNGSFEEVTRGRPAPWHVGGFQVVADGAPEGERFLRAPAKAPCSLVITDLPMLGGKPHLLSLWLRSDTAFRAGILAQDAPSRFGRWTWRQAPSTAGEWRRVGFYVRIRAGTTRARFMLRVPKGQKHGPIAVDDVRLRTATEAEMAKAYAGWRAQYPTRDLAPRPTDGANLALTVRKLERGLSPDRPFLIWAIGSSYTNMLGMGEVIIETIQQRFPNAPDIVYKKHVGASVPFKYLRGWARHIVIPEHPDLVLIYTIGKPEELGKCLAELRRGCTADIIVPSIHWRMRDAKLWGKSEDALDQDVSALREVCAQYGVEFVESRREWAEHMRKHNLAIEVDAEHGLLKDAVHQSDYGALIINENIARHMARPRQFSYDPDDRERSIPIHTDPLPKAVSLDGDWRLEPKECRVGTAGARLTVRFTGRRIDLIGRKQPDGGTRRVWIRVRIDGQPADHVPAFFMSFIKPGKNNTRPKRGLVTDRAPHGVALGTNVVPQDWTITMTDNQGNYQLVGSRTGPDGTGNCTEPFTSPSGQITIPPELWRYAKDRQGNFVNKKGDTFSWRVYPTTGDVIHVKGKTGERFRLPLAQNLPNAEHTLQLTVENGAAAVERFDVFEPPLK